MSTVTSDSPAILLALSLLIGLTTVNGALYGLSFVLYYLSAWSLYLQSKYRDVHSRQRIITLIFMSVVMALGLVSLVSDTRGIQLSFVTHADDPDPGRKGLNYFFNTYEIVNGFGIATQILMIILQCLLTGVQVCNSPLS